MEENIRLPIGWALQMRICSTLNTQAINDFKQYVASILNHVNTYTGIAYKNDPQFWPGSWGSELQAPLAWEKDMAGYIKSIDGNHLVASGNCISQVPSGSS